MTFFTSPLLGDGSNRDYIIGHGGFLNEWSFQKEDTFVNMDRQYNKSADMAESLRFVKAGPRKKIYFHPQEVRACVVTCGGLCPGLNVVL